MMSFDEFTESVARRIRDYLPAEYADSEVSLPRIRKINRNYTGLIVRGDGQQVTPAIRLELFYQDYLNGSSPEEILQEIADIIRRTSLPIGYHDLCSRLFSYESISSRLFLRVCGKQNNRELLERAPYHTVLDLALTCHAYLGETEDSRACVLVTHDMLQQWHISKAQLFRQAFRSSMELMPAEIRPMREILRENCGFPDCAPPEEIPMFVITRRLWGSAAALFYPGVFEELSSLADGDYYILPSSVNECIMVPKSVGSDPFCLRQMVREINRSIVQECEILSDNIYYYSSKKKRLMIAD